MNKKIQDLSSTQKQETVNDLLNLFKLPKQQTNLKINEHDIYQPLNFQIYFTNFSFILFRDEDVCFSFDGGTLFYDRMYCKYSCSETLILDGCFFESRVCSVDSESKDGVCSKDIKGVCNGKDNVDSVDSESKDGVDVDSVDVNGIDDYKDNVYDCKDKIYDYKDKVFDNKYKSKTLENTKNNININYTNNMNNMNNKNIINNIHSTNNSMNSKLNNNNNINHINNTLNNNIININNKKTYFIYLNIHKRLNYCLLKKDKTPDIANSHIISRNVIQLVNYKNEIYYLSYKKNAYFLNTIHEDKDGLKPRVIVHNLIFISPVKLFLAHNNVFFYNNKCLLDINRNKIDVNGEEIYELNEFYVIIKYLNNSMLIYLYDINFNVVNNINIPYNDDKIINEGYPDRIMNIDNINTKIINIDNVDNIDSNSIKSKDSKNILDDLNINSNNIIINNKIININDIDNNSIKSQDNKNINIFNVIIRTFSDLLFIKIYLYIYILKVEDNKLKKIKTIYLSKDCINFNVRRDGNEIGLYKLICYDKSVVSNKNVVDIVNDNKNVNVGNKSNSVLGDKSINVSDNKVINNKIENINMSTENDNININMSTENDNSSIISDNINNNNSNINTENIINNNNTNINSTISNTNINGNINTTSSSFNESSSSIKSIVETFKDSFIIKDTVEKENTIKEIYSSENVTKESNIGEGSIKDNTNRDNKIKESIIKNVTKDDISREDSIKDTINRDSKINDNTIIKESIKNNDYIKEPIINNTPTKDNTLTNNTSTKNNSYNNKKIKNTPSMKETPTKNSNSTNKDFTRSSSPLKSNSTTKDIPKSSQSNNNIIINNTTSMKDNKLNNSTTKDIPKSSTTKDIQSNTIKSSNQTNTSQSNIPQSNTIKLSNQINTSQSNIPQSSISQPTTSNTTSSSSSTLSSSLMDEIQKIITKRFDLFEKKLEENEQKERKKNLNLLDKISDTLNTTLLTVIEKIVRNEIQSLQTKILKTITKTETTKTEINEDKILDFTKQIICDTLLPVIEASMDEMRVQMIAEVSSFKNNDYLKDLRQAIQELNLSNQNIEILYDNLIKNEEFDKLIDVVVNGDYKNLEVFVLFYDKINFNCVCSFNIVKMFSKICEYISDRCGKDDRCSERKDDRYSGNDKYNMTYVNDERKDDRYSGNVSNITNSKSIIQDENKSNTTISKSNITKFIKMQNILIDLLHFIELDNLNEEELKYFNNVLDKLKNSEWYNCEESVNLKILVSYISIRVLKRIGLNK